MTAPNGDLLSAQCALQRMTAGIVLTVDLANLGADGLVIRVDDDGLGGSVQESAPRSDPHTRP